MKYALSLYNLVYNRWKDIPDSFKLGVKYVNYTWEGLEEGWYGENIGNIVMVGYSD